MRQGNPNSLPLSSYSTGCLVEEHGYQEKNKKHALVARVENYQKISEQGDKIVDQDLDNIFTKSKLEKIGNNKENTFNIPWYNYCFK